jgi:hypothetical protein
VHPHGNATRSTSHERHHPRNRPEQLAVAAAQVIDSVEVLGTAEQYEFGRAATRLDTLSGKAVCGRMR